MKISHLGTPLEVGFYDAFADSPFKGNQAAVIKGTPLSDNQLLVIAGELLLPETSLYLSERNLLRLKFATSDRIISRCGHATLSAVADFCLEKSNRKGNFLGGEYEVDGAKAKWTGQIISPTQVEVSIEWPGIPYKTETLLKNRVKEVLRLKNHEIDSSLPLCIYNSGNLTGLVPIKNYNSLKKATPDLTKMKNFFKELNLTDLHLYFIKKQNKSKTFLLCRNLFPYGVREECATGSASVSLASALLTRFPIQKEKSFNFILTQGIGHRQGLIFVEVGLKSGYPTKICLKGRVHKILKGNFLISIPTKTEK